MRDGVRHIFVLSVILLKNKETNMISTILVFFLITIYHYL
jgi:hypothetical protein